MKEPTPATTKAMINPATPYPISRLTAHATATTITTKPAMSSAERRLLEEICSYSGGGSGQNWTETGPREVSSASKYSRAWNPNELASTLVGKVWMRVFSLSTSSL